LHCYHCIWQQQSMWRNQPHFNIKSTTSICLHYVCLLCGWVCVCAYVSVYSMRESIRMRDSSFDSSTCYYCCYSYRAYYSNINNIRTKCICLQYHQFYPPVFYPPYCIPQLGVSIVSTQLSAPSFMIISTFGSMVTWLINI